MAMKILDSTLSISAQIAELRDYVEEDRRQLLVAAQYIVEIAGGTMRSGNPAHITIIEQSLEPLVKVNAENAKIG